MRKKQLRKVYGGRHYKKNQVWTLVDYLAKDIANGVRQFRHMDRYGVPTKEDGCPMTEEEWNAVLDKIIWAFEEIAGDEPNDPRLAVMGEMLDAFPNAWEDERLEDGSCKSWLSKDAQAFLDAREEETAKAHDAYKARIEEGKQLFVKYIGALWD